MWEWNTLTQEGIYQGPIISQAGKQRAEWMVAPTFSLCWLLYAVYTLHSSLSSTQEPVVSHDLYILIPYHSPMCLLCPATQAFLLIFGPDRPAPILEAISIIPTSFSRYYLSVLLPHLLQDFAQMSTFQWCLPWPLFKDCTHFFPDSLSFFLLQSISP